MCGLIGLDEDRLHGRIYMSLPGPSITRQSCPHAPVEAHRFWLERVRAESYDRMKINEANKKYSSYL